MSLRIVFAPIPGSGSSRQEAVLTGLDAREPITIPAWLREFVKVNTLTGVTVSLAALQSAVAAFRPTDADAERGEAVEFRSDDVTILVDMALPLLALARDLAQLGFEEGDVTVERSMT